MTEQNTWKAENDSEDEVFGTAMDYVKAVTAIAVAGVATFFISKQATQYFVKHWPPIQKMLKEYQFPES